MMLDNSPAAAHLSEHKVDLCHLKVPSAHEVVCQVIAVIQLHCSASRLLSLLGQTHLTTHNTTQTHTKNGFQFSISWCFQCRASTLQE